MFIDEKKIKQLLKTKKIEAAQAREILANALQMKSLSLEETAALMTVEDPRIIQELFCTAKKVKENIYGKRLVIFAPLYISNFCINDCAYCSFRVSNKDIKRRALSQEEIAEEVGLLINQGQKRILLVTGEASTKDDFQYILDSIRTIYKTKSGSHGEIRRLNVNIAPLTITEFKQLKAENIGTYQLFQETYHKETYKKVHKQGKKVDYDWRILSMDRAMKAGIDDVSIGVLFGLYDWRFELLALLQHVEHLERNFSVGPHTISIPRIEPAAGAELASHPPSPVSDIDFYKLIAILRLAVPYTGIILSTRESPEIRRNALALGVSQISAGSRTNPGGYANKEQMESCQFSLGDHRSLDEVIKDVASMGYIPSFCTACYRLGRTGEQFMDLAKPGNIKEKCLLNALITFKEYLLDYASAETKKIGNELINKELQNISKDHQVLALIKKLELGERDLFV